MAKDDYSLMVFKILIYFYRKLTKNISEEDLMFYRAMHELIAETLQKHLKIRYATILVRGLEGK